MIEHHADFIDHIASASAIEVRCDGPQCVGELLRADGLFRAPLERAVAAELAWEIYFFESARQQWREPTLGLMGGSGYASHMRSTRC